MVRWGFFRFLARGFRWRWTLMVWSLRPKTASECQSGECTFPLMREATTMKATITPGVRIVVA